MTITQTLQSLAGGAQVGPARFESRNGRLFADVLDRSVAVDEDDESIRLTSPAQLTEERTGLVSDHDIAAAVGLAQAELGGLSELTWRDNKLVAWQWISPSSDVVEIATAARETVRMCLFAEGVVARLEQAADVRRQVEQLESDLAD